MESGEGNFFSMYEVMLASLLLIPFASHFYVDNVEILRMFGQN